MINGRASVRVPRMAGGNAVAMKRRRITSSIIKSVGYDEATTTMEIEFSSGAVYVYFVVPRATFEALVAADSAGRYFNERVRDVFPFKSVPT
jgi:hypothetical protein